MERERWACTGRCAYKVLKCSQEIPFLLEDKITALGGKYEKAPEPWGVSV